MTNKSKRMRQKVLLVLIPVLLIAAMAFVASACAPRAAEPDGQQGTDSTSSTESGTAGDNGTSAITVDWSPTVDCATCHKMEADSETNTAYLCGAMISQGAELACMDCHDDIAGMEKAHEGVTTSVTTAPELKETHISAESCLACHDQAEIIAATATSTVLTDADGTVVNPHDLPVAELSGHGSIICADCHQMHAPVTDRDKNAMAICVGCHHQNVFACGLPECHEME